MHIGIDFDYTITADGRCFVELIQLFQKHGHQVHIVSARPNSFDNYRYIENFLQKHLKEDEILENVGILLSYDEPKRSYCRRNGIDIAIWIDDKPERIFYIDKGK